MEELSYFRSHLYCLFTYFNISKADTALIQSVLELIDLQHKQIIDVESFSLHFFKEKIFHDCFMLIWDQYVPILSPPDQSIVVYLEDAEASKIKPRPPSSYFDFLFFLFFIMSLTDKDMSLLLYWMWFYKPGLLPTLEALCRLVEGLGGSKLTKKQVKQMTNTKKKIKESMKFVNFDDFNAKKFQLYNMQLGGVWLIVPNKMREYFKKVCLGKPLWNRVQLAVTETSTNFQGALIKIHDKKPVEGDEAVVYRDKGERKRGRRELRKNIRIFMEFKKMPLGEEGLGDVIGVDSFSLFFAPVVQAFQRGKKMFAIPASLFHWQSSSSIHPSTAMKSVAAVAEMKKKNSSKDKGQDLVFDKNGDIVVPVALEIRYKKSLTAPMESLFSQAHDAMAVARDLLVAGDDDEEEELLMAMQDGVEGEEGLTEEEKKKKLQHESVKASRLLSLKQFNEAEELANNSEQPENSGSVNNENDSDRSKEQQHRRSSHGSDNNSAVSVNKRGVKKELRFKDMETAAEDEEEKMNKSEDEKEDVEDENEDVKAS